MFTFAVTLTVSSISDESWYLIFGLLVACIKIPIGLRPPFHTIKVRTSSESYTDIQRLDVDTRFVVGTNILTVDVRVRLRRENCCKRFMYEAKTRRILMSCTSLDVGYMRFSGLFRPPNGANIPCHGQLPPSGGRKPLQCAVTKAPRLSFP